MIYWDIDDVIRDLATTVYGCTPRSWDQKIDGRSFIETVNLDPSVCATAPPCEYLSVLNQQRHAAILSIQPPSWLWHTTKWLNEHITTSYAANFVNDFDEKLAHLMPGDLLIDDSPMFKDYSKIILIDRRHNRHIKCPCRIYNPQQLTDLLKIVGG